MAASHIAEIGAGNFVRSAMTLVDFDGVDSNGIGSQLGLTVETNLGATPVDASAALLYTSTVVQDNHEFMTAATAALQAALTGATVRTSRNSFDQYVLHVEAIGGVADDVGISLPVLTVV